MLQIGEHTKEKVVAEQNMKKRSNAMNFMSIPMSIENFHHSKLPQIGHIVWILIKNIKKEPLEKDTYSIGAAVMVNMSRRRERLHVKESNAEPTSVLLAMRPSVV